ncbi:MAG TPA: MotA/TolQ/ExbB proton channel family protein [Acidimicrobiia bacterium]|jgi:biopolymer transport protein ExbB|nr:MotA/TolQ/ExbB proton channel family protein [Acidimicrobiia bacterium]
MGLDLVELWDNMSIIVKIITVGMVGMSVFMFYVIAERILAFSAASSQSIRYVQALGEYLRQNKVGDALNAARSMPKSPVAKVMESGLSALLQGREALKTEGPDDVGEFDLVDSVNRALERVKERETSNLRKGLSYLGTVASATPFIGLLGTVVGILGTFQLLKGGSVAIGAIGPKISEALVSTALGLAIAIIAAMSFNFFTSRVETFVIDMNDVSSEFIDYVLREGRG